MKISITKENKENKKGTKVVKIILCILFMLGVMFTIFTQWSNFTYGPVSGDQMLINLTSPTDGTDRKSTRLNSSHRSLSRMPSSA